MHRKLTVVLISLFALTVPLTASAQSSDSDIIKLLPGIQSANARRYISAQELDVASIGTPLASPVSGPDRSGLEELPLAGTATVTAIVLEFDSAATLTTVWSSVLDKQMLGMISGIDEEELKISLVDDLGDQAILATGEVHGHSTEVGLVVQDGNLGIILTGSGTDEASVTKTLLDIAAFMVASTPGTEPVTLDPPSGGTWDIFPSSADTIVLGNLIPVHDYDLLTSDEPLGD